MDDVNNMDNPMDAVEQAIGGLSRRDMIKASVVAGALVWSAPVLLSGTAHAQTGCCPSPFQEIALKFTSANPNCGVTCLDMLVDENVQCCQDLADALIVSAVYNAGTQMGGPPGSATITIDTTLATLTGASARVSPAGPGGPSCVNRVRVPGSGCDFPADPTDGRITFSPDFSQVFINLKTGPGNTAETLLQAEVLLCVRTSISLFC